MKQFRLIKSPYSKNVTEFREDEVLDVPKFDVAIDGNCVCDRSGGEFAHKAIFVSPRLMPHLGTDSEGYQIIVFTLK